MTTALYVEINSGAAIPVTVESLNRDVTQVPNAPVFSVVVEPGPAGQQGRPGPAGNGTQVFGETPAGVQDGSNEVFTLANNFQVGSTCVYRNGLREDLGVGYVEASPQITFTTAPLSDDVISVDYLIHP